MNKEYYAWTWLDSRTGIPQMETFATADEAIKGMAKRMGDNVDDKLTEYCVSYGFTLAYVKVTINTVLTLTEPDTTNITPED